MRTLEARIQAPGEFDLRTFYGRFYDGTLKSHVPNPARSSMLERMRPVVEKLTPQDRVLDLGSGRQIMERFMLRGLNGRVAPSCQFVTLDFADIKPGKLLERDTPSVVHVRGNGAQLPFRDGTFSAVFSDMAFEFMGDQKFAELGRVVKSDGHIFINVLHEKAPDTQIPAYEERVAESRNNKQHLRSWVEYWKNYQKVCSEFTQNPQAVIEKFAQNGMAVSRYQFAESPSYDWVEIDARKTA